MLTLANQYGVQTYYFPQHALGAMFMDLTDRSQKRLHWHISSMVQFTRRPPMLCNCKIDLVKRFETLTLKGHTRNTGFSGCGNGLNVENSRNVMVIMMPVATNTYLSFSLIPRTRNPLCNKTLRLQGICDVEGELAKGVGIHTAQYNLVMGALHVPVDGSLQIWFGDLRGSIAASSSALVSICKSHRCIPGAVACT